LRIQQLTLMSYPIHPKPVSAMTTFTRKHLIKPCILLGIIALMCVGCKSDDKKDDQPIPNDNAFIAGNWKLKAHITHKKINDKVSDLDDTAGLFITTPCLKGTTFVFQADGIFKFSDNCDWGTAGFYTNAPFTLSADHTTLYITDKDKIINKFRMEYSGNIITIINGDDISSSNAVLEKI
jgi:hypothetical protein